MELTQNLAYRQRCQKMPIMARQLPNHRALHEAGRAAVAVALRVGPDGENARVAERLHARAGQTGHRYRGKLWR